MKVYPMKCFLEFSEMHCPFQENLFSLPLLSSRETNKFYIILWKTINWGFFRALKEDFPARPIRPPSLLELETLFPTPPR